MNAKTVSLTACIALVLAGTAQAAQIVLVNVDPPGKGLNDTTPATPEGGNPGTTIGAQRVIAYQFAADLWGSVLTSAVPIRVQASFADLSCNATAGTLGSAGATTAYYGFPGATTPDIWYPAALADAVAGKDLGNVGGVAIVSRFNANLGQPNCLAGQRWYYGLDGKTPAQATNFINVVTHELGHGLGFASTVDKNTGKLLVGMSDTFSTPIFDHRSGLTWRAMTDAQRQAAIIGQGLVFGGATVTNEVPLVLDNRLVMNASGSLTASYTFGTANFGPEATLQNFTGGVVVVDDGSANGSQGCGQLVNAADVANNIALVDAGGGCISGDKSFYAQLAGAIGTVIVSNQPGAAPNLTDGYSNNGIPTLSLSQGDGRQLKAALPGANVLLAKVANRYQGADDDGRAMLYAPPQVIPGSSVSHWDLSMKPHTLMEPESSDTTQANLMLDLTPAAMKDIGWARNTDDAMLGGGLIAACDTGVKAVMPGGSVVGANITARSNVCRLDPGLLGLKYAQCVTDYASTLASQGLITAGQQTQIGLCAAITGLPKL